MDEPLGALDKKLRERLQLEIKDLQLKLGTTVLYVTHDQHEALTMADRIAVMSDGLIQQVGTPSQLYETPANEFVADFVGETHFIPGTLEHREGVQCWISTQDPQVRVTATLAEGLGEVPPGTNMVVAVRPERVQIARRVGADAGYGGRVVNVVYSGGTTLYLVQSPSGTVAGARVPAGGLELVTGDDVVLSWSPEHARAYAQDGSHVGR